MQRNTNTSLSISLLYQYVFEDIRAYTNPHVSSDKKDQKAKEIRSQFVHLTENIQFRHVLRELNSRTLEEIIYENNTEELNPLVLDQKYSIPDEDDINNKLMELNDHYQFFNNIQDMQKQFTILFRGCKLIADFIECNNSEDNVIAYLHAYKMLVLFGLPNKNSNPFTGIENYLSKSKDVTATPIFDALNFNLQQNNPALKDLSGWQRFIKNNGNRALEFFLNAQKLEEKNNGKSPRDMVNARKLAAQLAYSYHEQYSELAELCKHYHLNDEIFSACLKYEKLRKNHDNFPNILINGNEHGFPGYYLAKLPVNDPRVYLLGSIVHCCLSIGRSGESCIQSVITSPDTCFHVLLKGKKDQHPFLENGSIDYRHFKIVGEGYTWFSNVGNLTFDSWENLRIEGNAVISALLPVLARELSKKVDSIIRVTIGHGVKTPTQLKQSQVSKSELILHGHQYADSTIQSLVYSDEEKILKINMVLSEECTSIR